MTNKTLTNENGEFVFENEPPAAVELGVFYLLTGSTTKPMQRAGEVALDFDIQIPGYISSMPGEYKEYYQKIKLISASNLPALRRIADRLWSYLPEDGKESLKKMSVEPIQLPASTNNVIYVGDIVVHKNTESKDKEQKP